MNIPQEMSVAGEARLRLLNQWVQADRLESDHLLNGALRKWRNDVITRLHVLRPQRIRIPQVFLEPQGLSSQLVVILEDGSVREYLGRDASGMCLGRLIVPKK